MPSKYMIHTETVHHRFEPITESGIIAWEEGCLKCAVCVKTMCVYNVYENRRLDLRQMIESIDNQCMNCFRCVQGCPKELIHKSINPEYLALGDSYWTPDIISKLWNQAETGKIPVSGSGYPGPFCGPGFDSIWTDMSEIVRPTRDGIHGREYISTAVDLGKTAPYIGFTKTGEIERDLPFLLNIPLPIVMRIPPFGALSEETLKGWVIAAKQLGTMIALPQEMIDTALYNFGQWLIPLVLQKESIPIIPREARVVEVPWSEDLDEILKNIREKDSSLLICMKVPMAEGMEEKILSLVDRGISIIHLAGNTSGRFLDNDSQHVKDGIRAVHIRLVEEGIRDELTLLASGGIAMAEHVAKAIICGADAVFVDFPILIALECRMCRRCIKGLSCPVEVGKVSSTWVASRVVNLIGAWHNQLLEVMGAMGIRDARRLRGEVGRAIFFEDLDIRTFESMGEVEEGIELE